jgi:cation:H+ antiporter
MLEYVLMIFGFGFVIGGANFLVKGSVSLAKRLMISDLVVGLTVVAVGTSLPELFVNITASIEGNTGIAVGNILGSNIANILLILGASAIIHPLTITKGTIWKEIPLSLLAALLISILANDRLIDGSESCVLSRADGLVLLSFFLVFVYYLFSTAGNTEGLDKHLRKSSCGFLKIFLLITVGLTILIIGSKWVVGGAARIAATAGVSESLIGLTIVAVGTSLPELATSTVAAYKKNPEIAVGTVVGSNIFNIFFILGISSVIRPLPFEAVNNLDISILILASFLLFAFMFTLKKRILDRLEAAIFVFIYIAYVCFIVAYRGAGS